MPNYLDLDKLTKKVVKFQGKEYSFNAPPFIKLKELMTKNKELQKLSDPEAYINGIAPLLIKLIPEVPREFYNSLSGEQLIKFIEMLSSQVPEDELKK